ncbi:dihydrofolate reductase family protein [Actinoplanes regularis]|uniref:Dihydrofolate reductase n=1 Tax=Actinoplanes regularis TaxID=52697 RepID=A0A238YCE3_9ACTN|nr:dihydrofolate reductase family protein [Actinoplanes regularis]GIE86035.1 deaminase [Actinoplanes regularis]SNR68263.1 Dihydrofolate reductase [Actinoplanes regularis]
MRRLILQMQMSVDGFVSGHGTEKQWQVWDWGPAWPWDARLREDFNTTIERADTILLSRKMAEEGYLDHWASAAERHRDEPDWAFASRIGEADKVVVTGKLAESRWPRTRIADGPLADEVAALKQREGGDILCFGGTGFASALIENRLVDELQLYVNPAAVGAGETIFDSAVGGLLLDLADSRAYDCGIVVNRYRPR